MTVKHFNTAEGAATVAIGFGRGKRQLCLRNILTKEFETRGVHPSLWVEIDSPKAASTNYLYI